MKLFDILPEKFYSILTGKNKQVYASSLLLLYNLVNDNDMYVKKDEFLRSLKEKLSNEIETLSIEEENEFDNEEISTSVSSKANLVLRRLEDTGWIELEMDPETYDEFIVLPNYSIICLESIFNVVNESSAGYSSLVHTMYSELYLENQNKDEFMYPSLLRAYENTKKLRVDLITLSHSIKIYQSRLAKLYTSNEVLHSYFDNYKELISDRLYHPLKTFDSVTRFKRPIINILESWLKDENTKKLLIKQAMIYQTKSLTPQEIESDIITKINYITDMLTQLSKMIDQIDKSHRDYTKASANKILYLNNTDKSVKGNLETILVGIGKYKSNYKIMRDILSSMQDSIYFYDNGFIDSDSVTLPFLRKFIHSEVPLEIMGFNELDDYAMQSFLDSVNGMFTDEMVFKFMQEVFQDKDEIKIEEIPLVNFDALILLILATIKRDEPESFYEVDYSSSEKVHSQGYILPKMIFKRKKKGD